MGLQQAKDLNADILLGTDPDADRVGVGVKNNKGEWILMNGNQTALLAFNYMIEARKAKGIAQSNDMVIKTIVTTDMIDIIAKSNNVAYYNVLTGFKWIASMIKEKEGKENYVEAVTTVASPVLKVQTGRGQQINVKKFKVADLVEVMGWKAAGAKLVDFSKSVEMEWEEKKSKEDNQGELF
jgi:hypothetical protein